MAKKKITKKVPVEKLSEKEILVEIEDSSDSSSEEEFEQPVIVAPKEKPKKQRSAAQLANDQRLRERAVAKKKPVVKEEPVVKKEVIDEDDKPLTMKQYKELIAAQQKIAESKPKPKRPYTRRPKNVSVQQEPPSLPQLTRTPPQKQSPPQMLFV